LAVLHSADTVTTAREVLHAAMLLMRSVSAHLRQTTTHPLAPAQLGTLLKIGAGPCTLSELARHQAVSLPTVSRSVDMLVRRGWVERTMDDTDRRQTLLGLTEQGRQKLADVKARAEQHIAERLSAMSSSDREELTAAAQLLASVFADRSASKDSGSSS
jgi:MarR family transcriptional regulator, organic hydroperoxide resistance regulator